jgi:pyrimidine-nucleoside phosphorylase
MIETQGGDSSIFKNPEKYKRANLIEEITANESGFISSLDAMRFGQAAVQLGCGRMRVNDKIDYSAGITLNKKTGDEIIEGEVICCVAGESEEKINSAKEIILSGIEISNTQVPKKSKILEIID